MTLRDQLRAEGTGEIIHKDWRGRAQKEYYDIVGLGGTHWMFNRA